MEGFVSSVILDGLDDARFNAPERAGAFRVVAGGHSFPVLRKWKTGFSLSEADAPKLRGLVEVYEGQRYILMGLVVAQPPENGEVCFEFKRATHVTTAPAVDFIVAPEKLGETGTQEYGAY